MYYPPELHDCRQVTDPEDDTIFEENISIGAKLKEFDYTINKRGVYDLCFELTGGKIPTVQSQFIVIMVFWNLLSQLDFLNDRSIAVGYCAGKVPVRIFFHVDYKPVAADGKALSRKVGKDDITGTV